MASTFDFCLLYILMFLYQICVPTGGEYVSFWDGNNLKLSGVLIAAKSCLCSAHNHNIVQVMPFK